MQLEFFKPSQRRRFGRAWFDFLLQARHFLGGQVDHFSKGAPNKAQIDNVIKNLQLEEATEKAIKLCRQFTTELESHNPVVRCLAVYSMEKVYRKLFPKVFEALEKIGV